MAMSEPFDILLVEDNRGDVRLTREAFAATDVPTTLHVVKNGADALEFCRQRGEYADAPSPAVILLDLSLPGADGQELIETIRADAALRHTPVVVFTSSASPADVRGSYDTGANAYLTKPVDPDEFMATVQSFAEFWLSTARLPDGAE